MIDRSCARQSGLFHQILITELFLSWNISIVLFINEYELILFVSLFEVWTLDLYCYLDHLSFSENHLTNFDIYHPFVDKKKKENLFYFTLLFIFQLLVSFFSPLAFPIWESCHKIWSFSLTFPFFVSFFVQVEIQKLRLYCDPHQSERETACEIYSVVRPLLLLSFTVISTTKVIFCILHMAACTRLHWLRSSLLSLMLHRMMKG